MSEYLLGLDVGTSSMCCVLTDTSLRPVSIARAPMSYYTPPDCSSITWELSGADLISQAGKLVAKVAHQQGATPQEVVGLGVTSQRQAVVLIDAKGQELLCSPNIDMRGVFQGAAIDDRSGEEVYALTGHFPAFLLAASRIGWLQDSRPALYERLATVLPLGSWLACAFTGARVSEPSIDAEAGLLDIPLRSRSARLEEVLGLKSSWLPPLCPAGAVTGGLGRSIADRWGLAAGTPVTIAGPDTQCALLGLGVVEAGQQAAVLGWSGTLQRLTAGPCFDPGKRTWVGHHTIEGQWVAEANLGDLGHAYQWLKDLVLGGDELLEKADALAEMVEPGAKGVMALLGGGPLTAPRAGLTTGGVTIPVPLTFQTPTPNQILRASLESIAFTLKANLATLEEVAGPSDGVISVAGGMASSPTLMQMVADVTGTPVQSSSHSEATARGAAAAAGVAAGLFGSLLEAVDYSCDTPVTYTPRPSESADYEFHYQRWLDMANNLRNIR